MNTRGMWRKGLAGAFLLAAAAVTAVAGPPVGRTPAPIGDVYLSLGGYMADGDGATDEETTSFGPVLLRNYLEPAADKPIQFVDLAKDEGSTDHTARFLGDYRENPDGESTMANVMRAIREAKAQGLRVSPITVEIGGEDLFVLLETSQAEQDAARELLRDQLAFILDELVDAVTDAEGRRTGEVIVLTYYNPLPDIPEVGAFSERLNALIRKMARTRGLGVADVDKAFAGKEADLLDGLVPNDAGHEVVAAEIWKAMGLPNPTAGG